MKAPDLLFDGPLNARFTVVLAHGAGAPMDSPFMDAVAGGVAARGLRVARFEFPYMRARRELGGRRPPDRAPALIECWLRAMASLGDAARLVIGGKSMGGRIASMVADERQVDGLVCMGYPFHPPRAPEKLRTAHLERLHTSTLILQGTRDTFGLPEEITGYRLAESIRIHWLEDGDHSFKPRVMSGRTLAQNMDEAVNEIARFAAALP